MIFTQGCNFTCPFCHNPDLVPPFGYSENEAGVLDFLNRRRDLLDAVVISGGEPTEQPDLKFFLKKIRALGYLIKLDTNGSNPEAVAELISLGLVDYLALDIKTDPANYPSIMADQKLAKCIAKTIALIKRLKIAAEFRTTCVSPFVDEKAILSIAQAASGEAPLFLQRYRGERVLNPNFMALYPNQPDDQALIRFRDLALPYLPCLIRDAPEGG